jgi:GT2 family glycosyltransferase
MCVVGVQGASFFVKRDIFDTVGVFDELIPFGGEDVDVGIRSLLMGFNNYIFADSRILHIGMDERADNIKYRNKFRFGNTSLFYNILKNYSLSNLLLSLPLFSVYQFIKILKDSVVRQDPSLIVTYFNSFFFLFKNRKVIFEKRKEFQSKRLISKDIFFDVKFSTKQYYANFL